MSRYISHIALVLLFTLSGCINSRDDEQKKKWAVTLEHEDKRAYGSFLAYESLKYFFPGTDVQSLSPAFKYTSIDNSMKYNKGGRTMMVLNGFTFRLSDREWQELKQYVYAGNEAVIFCSKLDERIEKELGFEKKYGDEESSLFYSFEKDHSNKKALHHAGTPGQKYGYKGRSIKGYFTLGAPADDTSSSDETTYADTTVTYDTTKTEDTAYDVIPDSSAAEPYDNSERNYEGYTWYGPDTLGYVYDTAVNIIRYGVGEGHITFHAAPLVLSNYFLLQENNIQYLASLWHTMPDDIGRIYWSDYYMRNSDASSTDILWRYASTKLAVSLGILILLVYILFEGKRKQRIIPIIEPLKNESVSFVETVGRLYYNKGDHANLAEKMSLQFLEWVRTYYFLNTNQLNEHFIQQLTIKSGHPEATVRGLVEMIHEIRLRSVKIDDPYLYQLYNTIQQFYKNHRI